MNSTNHLVLSLLSIALGWPSIIQAQEIVEHAQQDQVGSVLANRIATYTAPKSSVMIGDTFYYEDFSDISDWTFENINPDSVQIWERETNPDLSADNGDTRYQTFTSPTVGNGFMWFDYRKYIQDAGIPIGAPPYPQLIGSTISPYLNWSDLDPVEGGLLRFFSYQPTLNIRNCRVDIRCPGIPDEILWTAFQGADRPNTAPQQVQFASIPERFIGQDSVQLVLVHAGDFYGWAVDDILILTRPEIEAEVSNFFAIAPNAETPQQFTAGTPMSFVADIQNNGAETLDLKLAITIADAMDVVIYTDTLLYEGIATDSLAENQAFPNSTPMPTEVGDYTGTYELFTDRIDEDVAPGNNAQTYSFSVTDSVFSKGATGLRTLDCCADNDDYSSSNVYYTPDIAATDSLFILDITTAISYTGFEGDDIGFMEIKTYGFRGDLNGDGVPSYGDAGDPGAEFVELSLLDFRIDTSSASPPSGQFLTYVPSEDGPVYVPNEYIGFAVAVDYYSEEGGTNTNNNWTIYGSAENYAAFDLASDSTGNSRVNHTLIVPARSIDTYGHFNGASPFIDATVAVRPFVSSTQETQLNTAQFDVRPNPATTQFNIDFDFGTSVNAQFEIINAVGQTVSAFNRDGLSTGAITIPTQGMNNGLYYVKVRTNDGHTASRKLLLNR